MSKRIIVHKLDGENGIHLFSLVKCGANGGIANQHWEKTTCKKCLRKRKKK